MILKYTERLKQIDHLIKEKSTGSPTEFAKKLGVNVRTWYKWRDTLINDLGLPIDYSPVEQTYFYSEEGTFEIGFRKISDYPKTKVSSANGLDNIIQNYKFVSARQFFVSRITTANDPFSYLEIQLNV